MAKQTFTTGQVLTSAQMQSLQQTAMGGGSATAKTASYTLVAADAGTTVIMDSATATTCTVNTGLFAAGDTVNIQNIGAGILTVTAGSATVNTAGSLALNQYEGGILYFRSTSASTFFDYVQTGSVSPLTTKGDLYGFSTLDARVPIGANNTVLTADSSQSLGLKWAAVSANSMTLLSTTTLTSSSNVIASIDQTYTHLQLYIQDWYPAGPTNGGIFIRVNSNTTSPNYAFPQIYIDNAGNVATQGSYGTQIVLQPVNPALADNNNVAVVNFYFYTSSLQKSGFYVNNFKSSSGAAPHISVFGSLTINEPSAITSITILSNSTLSGTALLYGVK